MGVFKRGDNYYVDFWFKGQRIREMIGPDRNLAKKVMHKRMTEIGENKYLDIRKDPDPITFHDFAKKYLKWAKTNKKASTYQRDMSILRTFDRELGSTYMHQITAWQLEEFKSKRRKQFKAASVNRELCVFKHLFSKAVEWGDVKENVTKTVKRFKGETKRLRFLMPDEIQILLPNCDRLMRGLLKPLVTLALNTGARKGELQSLKWSEVNFELGIISFLDTKNGERRDVPMNEKAREVLQGLELKKNGDRTPAQNQATPPTVASCDLVFPSRNGNKTEDAQVQLAFKEAVKRSGIEDFRFHDLRHTFASLLVMEGVDLNTVRELLGHKDLKMTLRYAHLAPSVKTKAINVLDGVFDRSLVSPHTRKVVELRR